MSPPPRRAPAPDARQRDAERTRAALVAAALEEFAAKGLAGARVSAIADRAGVNKQLISYYFGGKEGLYRAILQDWYEAERELTGPGTPLADTVVSYLRFGHEHPDLQRMFVRVSLDGGEPEGVHEGGPQDEDLELMRAHQRTGELMPELDPGFALLFLQSMVIASTVFPDDAQRLTGLDPGSAEFVERAEQQLRLVVARLAERPSG